jgi:endonuclease/exonuclease/phosphatase family metal-dependent hydrolase
MSSHLSLATFNVHCGVDGWGRPFDVVAECDQLDADVVVMQESWTPDGDGLSTAELVADKLGYQVVEHHLARGRLAHPATDADHKWGPGFRSDHHTLRLDGDARRRIRNSHYARPFTTGSWGLALLTRVPITDPSVLPLGQLRRDPAHRVAITCTVDVGGRPLVVVGTHMSHLLHRSPVQYRRLLASLPEHGTPAVMAGDMNLWGPLVITLIPKWRRAVIGQSWPSKRPHSQLDHVLVTPAVSVVDSRVATRSGSDHRPVRVVLSLDRPDGG